MPDGGTSALVAASIGRARAMKMAMLAQRVYATDAAEMGLIAEAVGQVELLSTNDFLNAARAFTVKRVPVFSGT